MEQKLMITSLPQAFQMIKEMNVSGEWYSDYREAGRRHCLTRVSKYDIRPESPEGG
jgi:hypothetical protein